MVSQERLPKKGSDFHYASGYNQLLSCGICMGALFRPVEMECDHCFCEHCIQTHVDREGPVCPVCSKIGSEVTPYKKVTKILNDLVGQLPVTCRRQADDGTICNQTFKRDALGEHRAVCEFRVITCPKECGASFLRSQLLAHEAACPNNLAFRYASPEQPAAAAATTAAAAAAAPLPQQAAPWGTAGSPAASTGMDLDTDDTAAPAAPHAAAAAQSDNDAVADTPFAADFSTKSSVKRPMGKRAKMLRRHHTPQKTGDDPMQESSPAKDLFAPAPSSPGWMAAGTAAAPRTSSPPPASAEPQQPPHVAHQMRSPSVGHTAGFAAEASPPPPAGPGTHLPGFGAQQQRTRHPDSGSMRSSEGTQSPGQPQPAPHVVWGAQEPVEEFARPSDFGSSSMTDAVPVAPPAAAAPHKSAEPKRTSKKLKIKGDDAYEKGDYATAIEYWSQAVEIDDGSTKAAVVYGNRSAARYMSQQFQSCIEDCRRALQDDPCNAKLWSRLNKASCCMGDIALSISLLGAAVLEERWDNKPNDRVLVQNEHDNCVMLKQQLEEVATLTAKGNTRKAEEILTQHQTKCSDWPEYGIAVANLMIAKGDLYGAIAAVDKFIALGEERPNGSVVREVLAECFLVKSRATYLNGYDKMKEATRIVKAGLQIAPNMKKLGEYLKKYQTLEEKKEKGNERFKNKEWSVSAQLYTEGLLLAGDCPEVAKVLHTNRAAARKEMKQIKLAVEDCTAALNLDPNFTRAYTRRGRCHLELNDFEKGIADFKSAQKCGGNSNDIADLLRDAERRRDAKSDFYSLLGVSRNFSNSCEKTKKELKQKYKNLCLRWHPDKVRGNDEDQQQAEKKFKQVSEAYATLSDAVKRREYDRTLAPSLRSFTTASHFHTRGHNTNPFTQTPFGHSAYAGYGY